MKNIKTKVVSLLSVILLVSACETTSLDLLDNNNTSTPDKANPELLLSGAMTDFIAFNEEVTDLTMSVSRMTHMYGPVYANAYSPAASNDLWREGYANVLANTNEVIKQAPALKLYEHAAVAKILQAYTLTTLVDIYGDVPYSEANNNDILNPSVDKAGDVYKAVLNLLNEAIADLEKDSNLGISDGSDIYYSGDADKWDALAKTLKLRLYNNVRLTDMFDKTAVEALIAEGDFIQNSSQDFEVKYSTNIKDPDTRSVKFKDGYLGDPDEYMSTYFMSLLKDSKSIQDPRIRYYFYRQTFSYPDATTSDGLFTLPCLGESKPDHYGFNDPFCTIGSGYWGRDHGNAAGGPPDGNLVTVWGLYPAGGKYDNNQFNAVKDSDGAKGAGILPLITASNTNFILAELALEETTTGDVKSYIEAGIRASMTKVMNFKKEAIPSGANTADSDDVDAYVNEVLTNYDAASNDEKLNILITESFISNWGNGLEGYNAYRRTSMPNDVQPTIAASPGDYVRSFPYASEFVNLNSSVDAKSGVGVKVFWDTNPDNLK
ncbi:SusD/RagB family nutrient-binding outer membrane lipoprotein [Tenacibaculum salmonis]|uniref:SusD/RagB family nutrient-binding outer membrane lipoprotein n=1 Tax=Tenacibaculum sp. P3-BQ1 TaxID=3232310 RepID=UPI0034DF8464